MADEELAVVLIPCGDCGVVFLTGAKPGEGICPTCGGSNKLVLVPACEGPEPRSGLLILPTLTVVPRPVSGERLPGIVRWHPVSAYKGPV